MMYKYRFLFLAFFLVASAYFSILFLLGYKMQSGKIRNETAGTSIESYDRGVIRFAEIGEGRDALLFLHGFNGSLNAWDQVWASLEGCGHAIRLDIPGYGFSDWEVDDYTLGAQSERIHQFLVKHNIDRITLVGVSMGGSLSAKFASDYPEMVKAVVLAAPSGYPGSLRQKFRYGYTLHPGWKNQLATFVVRSPLYKALYPDSVALQALTVTSSYNSDWAEGLKKIKSPVVLLWSPGDTAVLYDYAKLIAGNLEFNRIVTLPEEVRHNVPVNAAPLVRELACVLRPDSDLNRDELFVSVEQAVKKYDPVSIR